jgi:HlyD family secretion protein
MTSTTITTLASRCRAAAFFTAIAVILCIATGCSKDEKEKEPVVSVQTTPAQRAPISQVISAEAVVYPLEQATVAPKISSTIKKFYVQRGARVKKGQLLAELENRDLSAAAESTKGDFEQADANYVTTIDASLPQQIQKAQLDAVAAKSNFEAQQKVYESRKELFQQGAIPRKDLDSAEVAFLQARSQNEQAQKQLADLQRVGKEQTLKSVQGSRASAEGRMRGAEAQLSYSRITSPIDGVVTDRPLFEGDLATANQPLLTVMNTSRLIAKAHIAQSEAAVLKVGNPAELKIPALEGPVKGRVSLVSPALDPGSTTIEVWVEASKPDPALKPGMTVQLSMTAKTVKDALVVPTPAIYKNPEGTDYVLLVGSDGHARLKTVQVGVRNAEFTQIVSGVAAGDPVISSGGYGLPDNTQVKVETAAAVEKDSDNKSGKSEKPAAAARPAAKEKD